MQRNKALFIPIMILLLSSCTAVRDSPTVLINHTESTPTETPVLEMTDKPTPYPDLIISVTESTLNSPDMDNQNVDIPDADVIFVRVELSDSGIWTFHVTVKHPDTGWDDYADGWDVVLPDGTVLKVNPDDPFTRPLLHPHENEQPFTRSQSGLIIPDDIHQVIVRAHDSVSGFGGQEILVDFNKETGPGFKVHR